MKATTAARLPRALLLLLLGYGAASLLHFAHNAEFLADYPNMPAWLTLAHYARAPLSAHTMAMNVTIWLEILAATLLLAMTARLAAQRHLKP